MPTSLLAQWPFIHGLLRSSPRPAGRVLDVGPGVGKASILLLEYVPSVVAVGAVEACEEYVNRFRLRSKYRLRVYVGRFEEMATEEFQDFDTLLMVDVIEHMEMELAKAAVRRFVGQVLICTPVVFEVSWRPGLPETERHISVWGPDDLADMGHPVEEIIDRNNGWIVRLGPREA